MLGHWPRSARCSPCPLRSMHSPSAWTNSRPSIAVLREVQHLATNPAHPSVYTPLRRPNAFETQQSLRSTVPSRSAEWALQTPRAQHPTHPRSPNAMSTRFFLFQNQLSAHTAGRVLSRRCACIRAPHRPSLLTIRLHFRLHTRARARHPPPERI